MDDKIIDWLHKEYKLGKSGNLSLTPLHFMLIIGITAAGIILRTKMYGNISNDFAEFLTLWVEEMHNRGGFKGLAGNFYNYTPPYVLAIYLLSLLPCELLYSLKTLSVIFDLLIAIIAAFIIHDITKSRTKSVGIYAIMLMLPTIAVNSALWGQCDSIYTSMLLFSFYFLLKDKPAKSMLFYGIAFALKLQSVFVLPVYIILWVFKKIDLKHFLFIPLMYFIGILPALIAGRPLIECLTIYAGQSEPSIFPYLSLNYPNIYYVIGNSDFIDGYSLAGIWLTFALLMGFMFFVAKSKVKIRKEFMIELFMLSSLIVMCFLPYVHERYAYLIDLLAVIYAFIYVNRFYIALIQILTSFSAYSLVLSAFVNVPAPIYGLASLFLVLFMGYRVYDYCKIHENELDETACISSASIAE